MPWTGSVANTVLGGAAPSDAKPLQRCAVATLSSSGGPESGVCVASLPLGQESGRQVPEVKRKGEGGCGKSGNHGRVNMRFFRKGCCLCVCGWACLCGWAVVCLCGFSTWGVCWRGRGSFRLW